MVKKVKLGVGPVIEGGFYYDIDLDETISPEDLPRIEKEMRKSLMKISKSSVKK